MFQESGIYFSSHKMSKPLILLDEMNSHLKYVYSSRTEELAFSSRIQRTRITYPEVYLNKHGLI